MTYNFSAAAGDQSVFIAQAGQYTNDMTVFVKILRSTIKTLPESGNDFLNKLSKNIFEVI